MIAELDAKSPVAMAFDQIAQLVTGRVEARRGKRPALTAMLAKLRGKGSPG